MNATIANVIGMVGVSMILASYFLNQIGRLSSRSLVYLSFNFLGAVLIIFSLFHDWNLAAFIIELSWAIISLYGIARKLKKKS